MQGTETRNITAVSCRFRDIKAIYQVITRIDQISTLSLLQQLVQPWWHDSISRWISHSLARFPSEIGIRIGNWRSKSIERLLKKHVAGSRSFSVVDSNRLKRIRSCIDVAARNRIVPLRRLLTRSTTRSKLLTSSTTKVLFSVRVLLIAALLIGLILLTHLRMLRLLWWRIHLRLQSVNQPSLNAVIYVNLHPVEACLAAGP